MDPKTRKKLRDGQTIYLKHPTDDYVCIIPPDSDYLVVKQKRNNTEYSIHYTTDLGAEFNTEGIEITEQEYKDYGS
jgi:hypothetical protein